MNNKWLGIAIAGGVAFWLFNQRKKKMATAAIPPSALMPPGAAPSPGAPPMVQAQGAPVSVSSPQGGGPLIAPIPEQFATAGPTVEDISQAAPVYVN